MKIKTRKEAISSLVTDQNENVYLTITIGNAQIGGSVVRWKGSSEIIGKGEISALNLGKGSSVKGKTLAIMTNVLDVNLATNGIVINYYFQNASDASVTFSDTVDNHGDVFSLELDVTFK